MNLFNANKKIENIDVLVDMTNICSREKERGNQKPEENEVYELLEHTQKALFKVCVSL